MSDVPLADECLTAVCPPDFILFHRRKSGFDVPLADECLKEIVVSIGERDIYAVAVGYASHRMHQDEASVGSLCGPVCRR